MHVHSLHMVGFGAKDIIEHTELAKRTFERWLKRQDEVDGQFTAHL